MSKPSRLILIRKEVASLLLHYFDTNTLGLAGFHVGWFLAAIH
jgi:hypothetical protein